MAGAGAVSLGLFGESQSKMAKQAGDYILKHQFLEFNRGGLTPADRYFYGAFYCSLATHQLGGEYFANFYPGLLTTLQYNQNRNGSWDREATERDAELGYTYSTSLALLALTPPYQLLPKYRRGIRRVIPPAATTKDQEEEP